VCGCERVGLTAAWTTAVGSRLGMRTSLSAAESGGISEW
jgi:hypothetical protein